MRLLVLIFISALFLQACSDEAWTRGLPKSVSQLVFKSQTNLQSALQSHGSTRQTVSEIISKVDNSLDTTLDSIGKNQSLDKIKGNLNSLRDNFQGLEGKLSVTSRAAYGELSGQLRDFIASVESGNRVNSGPFGLFSARTRFFLADELEVPAPKF